VKRVIVPDAWDSDKEKVIDTHPEASIINDYIRLVYGEINRHYNMLLSTQSHATPDMVKESYLKSKNRSSVLDVAMTLCFSFEPVLNN